MLKNRYEEIIIGEGILSLTRGIISSRKGKSVLLIDDDRFSVDHYPMLFVSELEILSLVRLGLKYDIPEFLGLRDFLIDAQIDLVTDKKKLTLGRSPLANFKEVIRKFPELLDPNDLDLLYGEKENDFNEFFLAQLRIFESQNYEAGLRSKVSHFALSGPKWLRNVYQKFGELLNKDYESLKTLKFEALRHFLGISCEEKFKKTLQSPDLPFYFFRLFSPIYRVREYFLYSQLRRRLSLQGGDFKKSRIQFWQFYRHQFENLLLESFEGVIASDKVLFFSHLPNGLPFSLKSKFRSFKKYQVQSSAGRHEVFPANCLTLITEEVKLGTDRPYRSLISNQNDDVEYHWTFPEMPGSKADFYDQELVRDFKKDAGLRELLSVQSNEGLGVSLDLRSVIGTEKNFLEPSLLKKLPFKFVFESNEVREFEYWGPFRYQFQGALSLLYGLEVQ